MSISYRQGYQLGLNHARKVNTSVKLYKQLSIAYDDKLSAYDRLRSELTSSTDIGHDLLTYEEYDNKLASLNSLRDDLIGLEAQLELLDKI